MASALAAVVESDEEVAPAPNAKDRAGFSVAIAKNPSPSPGFTIVMGAVEGEGKVAGFEGGDKSGRVYVYHYDAAASPPVSTPQALAFPTPTPVDNSLVGDSVAIEGERLVVGAPGTLMYDTKEKEPFGRAFVFKRTGYTWALEEELVPDAAPTPTPFDQKRLARFGSGVAISGQRILVGASGLRDKGFFAGAVYVFKCVASGSACDWQQEAKLTATGTTELDRFGFSVALSGDTALIGAPGEGDVEREERSMGAAFIFEWNATTGLWEQKKKLTRAAADRKAFDYFGWSVALDGDYAAVGAPGQNQSDTVKDTGAVYVFERNEPASGNWGLKETVIAFNPNPAAGDFFGSSVAIVDASGTAEKLVVGARSQDDAGRTNAGSAYLFERNTSGSWAPVDRWKTQGTASSIRDHAFGFSVALEDGIGVVGAPGNGQMADGYKGLGAIFDY